MEGQFVDNEALQRFEWHLGGSNAFIQYRRAGTRVTLIHTEVPSEFRGMGAGRALVEAALHFIDGKGWTIVVLCDFINGYLKKHPEWSRLIDPHMRPKGGGATPEAQA
jgi:uncharacterized protein